MNDDTIQKQAYLIDLEVQEVYDRYPALTKIYQHNYQLGFQRTIIDTLTVSENDYVIKALQKVRGYKLSKAFNILSKLI